MNGLTDYITECAWEDVFTTWYVWIDDLYQQLYPQPRAVRERGPQPSFSDSETITVALICDTYFGGNEELTLSFLRQHYKAMFPKLLEDSRFNRRRRDLGLVTEEIRRRLNALLISETDELRLVDTAPIPVCTYMRGPRCRTIQGAEYCGVIPSKRAKLFGFRLHLTTTFDMVVQDWTLAPASFREATVVESLLVERRALTVAADQGYLSRRAQEWLAQSRDIKLLAAPLRTHRAQWSKTSRKLLNQVRRRIETALSVLATVFNLEHPASRSSSGLVARIATRILAYNLSFVAARSLIPMKN